MRRTKNDENVYVPVAICRSLKYTKLPTKIKFKITWSDWYSNKNPSVIPAIPVHFPFRFFSREDE